MPAIGGILANIAYPIPNRNEEYKIKIRFQWKWRINFSVQTLRNVHNCNCTTANDIIDQIVFHAVL